MENEKLISAVNKRLKIHFWTWLTVLVLLGVFCFLNPSVFPKLGVGLHISLQQILILCLMAGVPGILYWSKNKMKKLVEIQEVEERLKLYSRYVHIRQSFFFLMFFFILVLYAFTNIKMALMLLGALLCLCLFIVPTRSRLMSEASLFDKENESGEENEPTEETQVS
jgi:hypothetical protein